MPQKNGFEKLHGDLGIEQPIAVLGAVLRHPKVKRFLPNDHFFVDGTLVEAWASLRSFRAKDGRDEPPAPGRNGERDFHDETRASDTHGMLRMTGTPKLANDESVRRSTRQQLCCPEAVLSK